MYKSPADVKANVIVTTYNYYQLFAYDMYVVWKFNNREVLKQFNDLTTFKACLGSLLSTFSCTLMQMLNNSYELCTYYFQDY